MKRVRLLVLAMIIPILLLGPRTHAAGVKTFRVGAVFPLTGMTRGPAKEEYRGVEIAATLANRAGGVLGRPISLDVKNLNQTNQAQAVMRSFHSAGITTVLGAYSSQLSIPASTAAAKNQLLYWEAGAEADRLTGRGLRTVFRVGATGANLGTNSARFAADVLAARLHKPAHSLRVAIVAANDDYASSVANAAQRESTLLGMKVISRTNYNPYFIDWRPVLKAVTRARADILILASHVPDGVSFRRAMLAAHVHVGAFIGSTMAECGPDFGAELGKKAIGVFASDRPEGGFNESALTAVGRSLYRRFQTVWRKQTGESQPSEEGLAGFSAAWVLFHDVLPAAQREPGKGSVRAMVAAARAVNLPLGSLPNASGVRFATDRNHMGQNQRAVAVVWQWQAVRHSVVVWPRSYATGSIHFVPLPH